MHTHTQEWDAGLALTRIQELAHLPGALLPVLHALQEEFGYIDAAAIPLIADTLNLSEADVHGVIGFYHDFRRKPPGRHVLQVCRAESCQAMGCDGLIRHIEERVRTKTGETAADRSITIEAVYCLGNCALSPALMLDGKLYGRVSTSMADVLLDDARRSS
jgi:formate dehydrogenase subunit gamma